MPETSTTDFNRAMRDAKKQAGGVANEVSDAASQVADAATNAARKTASSFEKALRDTHRKSTLYGRSYRARHRMAFRQNTSPVLNRTSRLYGCALPTNALSPRW
jgi:surface antigen